MKFGVFIREFLKFKDFIILLNSYKIKNIVKSFHKIGFCQI